MPTIEVSVAAGADDAQAIQGCAWFSNSLTYLQFDASDQDLEIFLRFAGVNVPQGATITVAYLRYITLDNFGDGGDISIKGLDEDDVGDFPNCATAEGYGLTTNAFTGWNPGVEVTLTAYNTPSLVDIVQEIVDRPGYAEDHMGFKIWNVTRTLARYWVPYEHETEAPVLLHTEYILPMAGGMQVPAVVALDLI